MCSFLKLFSYPYPTTSRYFFFSLTYAPSRFFATTNSKKDVLLFFRNPIWNVFVCECVYAPFCSCGTFFPASTKSCFTFRCSSNKTVFFHKTRSILFSQFSATKTVSLKSTKTDWWLKNTTMMRKKQDCGALDTYKLRLQKISTTGLDKALTDQICLEGEICVRKLLFLEDFYVLPFSLSDNL